MISGDLLALGAVAALAAASAAKRGSRSLDIDQLIANATRISPDWQLPDVGKPAAGTPPRWTRGWKKGGAWAREQLENKPMNAMDPKARKTVENNVLNQPDLTQLERSLRLTYGSLVQPHRIASARQLSSVAANKLSYALTIDQRAFWTGVSDYTVRVVDDWTSDPERAADFLDRTEIAFVRAWRKRKGSRSQQPFRFSGDVCVHSHEDIVNWSTDNWWYPTTTEQIEWSEFRDSVELVPSDVTASGYLGWQPEWEPFEQFIGGEDGWKTEPGGGTASWFKGTLPSGRPFYVWQGSGIEHWWTPGGDPIDQQAELAILESLYDAMEQLDKQRADKLTVTDTRRLLAVLRS